jgi:hypothetical protein
LMNVICPIQRSLKLDLPISSIPSVQDPPPYRGLYPSYLEYLDLSIFNYLLFLDDGRW